MRLAHIINPVKVSKSSDLYTVQPITFESMRRAKDMASSEVKVDLLTTQYAEDREIIPDYFNVLPDLERSVLDLRSFSKDKKLPLIQDILDRLYEYSNADYFIFTNVDIGLMPDFYLRIKEYIETGLDAFIINRRRINDKYVAVNDLSQIYQDKGLSHPGFDCFVFYRNLLPKIRLDNICVGIPFIGVTLAYNLFAFAENIKLFDKEHLTFHIGLDVMPKRDQEYYWYNRKQFDLIYDEYLKDKLQFKNIPYSELNFIKRYWRWGMNPSLFIFKLMNLEWQNFKKKNEL
jgi:hypothetical protein